MHALAGASGALIPPFEYHVLRNAFSDRVTVTLHVYGGDILELPRRMWNPDTLEEYPLDWTLYETFARAASAAAGAPA